MSFAKNEELQRVLTAVQPYIPYAAVPVGLYGIYKLLCYLVPGPQHQPKLQLKDKTVLITGASSGLGRALAFVFYQRVYLMVLDLFTFFILGRQTHPDSTFHRQTSRAVQRTRDRRPEEWLEQRAQTRIPLSGLGRIVRRHSSTTTIGRNPFIGIG